LLGLIICAYALAAIVPGPGMHLRDLTILKLGSDREGSAVTLLPLLLGLLLFCAGLRVRIDQVARTFLVT
jgi:bile acid:Na+ symporter, BASS family